MIICLECGYFCNAENVVGPEVCPFSENNRDAGFKLVEYTK